MNSSTATTPPAPPLPPRAYPPPLGLPRRTPIAHPGPTLVRTRHFVVPRDPSPLLLLFLLIALGAMSLNYFTNRHVVTITYGNGSVQFWTLQTTVRAALVEAGYNWRPEDIIRPGLDDPLPKNGKLSIQPALPVSLVFDGGTIERRTQSTDVSGLLQENGVRIKTADRVYLNGRPVRLDAALPRSPAPLSKSSAGLASLLPVRVDIERSVPVNLNDNGLSSTIYTTQPTLGGALRGAGVLVYLGDYVTPDLGNPVTPGATIYIRRSRPASITVDGKTIKTRTREPLVSGLLVQTGIQLEGKDYSEPAPTSPVVDDISVNITRVREVYVTETQYLPFQVRWLPNPGMELDSVATVQTGQKGAKNRLFKSVYENGKLISHGLEREWIAKPPQDQIINYGTKIVLRDLTLPDGEVVQYWRKLQLLATSYTAATSGKPAWHPEYGITFLGLKAGLGIVAVDPRIVTLRTNVYVPGYGVAYAGDTGGRIKGRRIDLGYPDGNIDLWYKWVDVYLLTPVPPSSKINYTILDVPTPRGTSE